MASQVQVINVALSRLGANEIADISEGSTEAKLSTHFWDISRQATLRDHPWNFAISEATLSPVSGSSSINYGYGFQLPSDCLRLLEVVDDRDFKIQGRRIYSDNSSIQVRYIADISDVSIWDTLFTDTFAQRLAAEMAYALTKSQTVADSNYALYERKIAKARFVDATEDIGDALGQEDSYIISARF